MDAEKYIEEFVKSHTGAEIQGMNLGKAYEFIMKAIEKFSQPELQNAAVADVQRELDQLRADVILAQMREEALRKEQAVLLQEAKVSKEVIEKLQSSRDNHNERRIKAEGKADGLEAAIALLAEHG
jgi:hypothetical protein